MKLALVHDYLNQYGGGEKALEVWKTLYPHSTIYTIYSDKKRYKYPVSWNVKTTFIQLLPKLKNYKFYFPLFPFATKTLNFDNYDIIFSSSHSYVKNINKSKKTLHICYCHTPMRYVWDLKKQYLQDEHFLIRPFISLFLKILAYWDKKNSKYVDYFIANSENVKKRIKKYYNRDADVIYSFVDCQKYTVKKQKDDYYLIVSRLIDAKRLDIAIRAFNVLGKKLIVIGTGREEKQLKKLAQSNITFLGFLAEKEVIDYYQRAKALIFPGIEDFGMVPIEAQSCGTPVIAYAKGGLLETVIEGKTGHFFHEQTPEALARAVMEFETMHFDPEVCRKNALRFDKPIFEKKIVAFINEKYTAHIKKQ